MTAGSRDSSKDMMVDRRSRRSRLLESFGGDGIGYGGDDGRGGEDETDVFFYHLQC